MEKKNGNWRGWVDFSLSFRFFLVLRKKKNEEQRKHTNALTYWEKGVEGEQKIIVTPRL